jgi:hypothetical protein
MQYDARPGLPYKQQRRSYDAALGKGPWARRRWSEETVGPCVKPRSTCWLQQSY